MKKFISMLLILTMVLSLGACQKAESAAPTAAPETETAAEATGSVTAQIPAATDAPVTEASEPDEEDNAPLYGDILDAYYKALEEGWTPEQYMGAGMNYMPGMVHDLDKVGYYLEDLDGDGSPELMIGEVGQNYIFVMYTIVEGSPVTVIHASERNTYQMGSDGSFVNRGSSSAFSSGYLFYTFENGSLTFQDALMFDSNADAENPWFYAVDEDWDVSNDMPYGTGDAQAYIESIEGSIADIPYMAFSSYHN